MILKTRILTTLSLLGVSLIPAKAALVDMYILDTFTSPANVSTPTFTFTSNVGYRLNLNSSGVAMGTSNLPGAGVSAVINAALTYNSTPSGSIDSGESFGGNFINYVNSEIGQLDDVGFIQEGSTDAKLNIDYGYHASVFFNLPQTGLSKLLIAEDAGLDPFKLELCTGTGANPGCSTLFNGWSTSVPGNVQSFLTSHGFGLNDTPNNIDQAYLFVFDSPITGYLRLSETDNPDSDSSRLEIDFIGGVTATPTPEPGFFALIGLSMVGMVWMVRRKKLALQQ